MLVYLGFYTIDYGMLVYRYRWDSTYCIIFTHFWFLIFGF